MTASIQSLLLYDGKCGLCRTMAGFVSKRDIEHKFSFIELQSIDGQIILKDLGLSTYILTSLVYIKNNHSYLKSSASLLLLKDLGGIWKVFYFLMLVPQPLRDFVYDAIAKYRHLFFRNEKSCKL